MLERLVLATQGRGLDQTVISLVDNGSVAASLIREGIPVQSLGMRRHGSLPDPLAVLRLARLLRRAKGDVIQCWMYHANLLAAVAAPLAGAARPIWGIRAGSVPRGRERTRTILTARLSARLAGVLARGVVVNGQRARATHIAQGYPAPLFEVIPNGFDLHRWHPDTAARATVRHALGLDANTPLIGYVANVRPIKDHATFFAAARQLVDAGSPAHFLLAGVDTTPENPVVRNLLAAHNLVGLVHALGERADVVTLTQALDIASLTSVDESFPNVVAEAMACAIPVVSTDAGDARDILGPEGRIRPVGDAAGVASDWQALLALTSTEREAIGGRLRVRVCEHYSMDAVAAQFIAYYRRMSPRHS
jgi:glycosyltransferase involved in cell wall biosynthesis